MLGGSNLIFGPTTLLFEPFCGFLTPPGAVSQALAPERRMSHTSDAMDEGAAAGVHWVSESSQGESVKLTLTLEPQLLRGTPISVALSGFCKHWRGLSSFERDLYSLSQPVESIDVFLSHDWETSRFMKTLTLLLCFNSGPAAVAALLCAIGLAALKTWEVIGAEWTFTTYLVFFIFLLFWQRMKCRLFPTMVFLDKLCIHQEDDKLKQKGILGLGAFVRASDKLLVLWSKRTFRRLWCAHEIGCFLSRTRRGQIEILPVTQVAILYLSSIMWHLLIPCYRWTLSEVREIDPDSGLLSVALISSVVAPVASVLLPLVNYLGMTMMDEIDELPQQLRGFEIQSCQCFCCSHEHQHPVTGKKLICDRELVYKSLAELYPQAVEPLSVFNSEVREALRPRILRRLRVEVPLKYLASLVWVSSLPLLSELISTLAKGRQEPAAWWLIRLLEFLQPCSAMLFALSFCNCLWSFRKLFKHKICLSILLAPIQGTCVGAVWAGFELTKALTEENSLWPLLPFTLALALNVLLLLCGPGSI